MLCLHPPSLSQELLLRVFENDKNLLISIVILRAFRLLSDSLKKFSVAILSFARDFEKSLLCTNFWRGTIKIPHLRVLLDYGLYLASVSRCVLRRTLVLFERSPCCPLLLTAADVHQCGKVDFPFVFLCLFVDLVSALDFIELVR